MKKDIFGREVQLGDLVIPTYDYTNCGWVNILMFVGEGETTSKLLRIGKVENGVLTTSVRPSVGYTTRSLLLQNFVKMSTQEKIQKVNEAMVEVKPWDQTRLLNSKASIKLLKTTLEYLHG